MQGSRRARVFNALRIKGDRVRKEAKSRSNPTSNGITASKLDSSSGDLLDNTREADVIDYPRL